MCIKEEFSSIVDLHFCIFDIVLLMITGFKKTKPKERESQSEGKNAAFQFSPMQLTTIKC